MPQDNDSRESVALLRAILQHVKRLTEMSESLSGDIAALQTSVETLTTTDASAIALIQGFSAQLAAATAAAAAAGATEAQLAQLTSLRQTIDANTVALGNAVVSNTPTPPPPPTPVTVTTTALPDAVVGSAYSGTIVSAGGTGPYSYTSTPATDNGLTVNSDGTVTGTPVGAAISSFSVTSTDSLKATGTGTVTVNSVAAAATSKTA